MNINCSLIDQRSEKTNDGRPPEDGNMDCVPTSLASMARALVPGASLNGTPVSGDGLHDIAYGQGYVGMQDPARYAPILARLFGIAMTCYRGAAADLVAQAMDAIAHGMPVLLSIPSDWGDEPPHSQYAHMVAGCDVPSPDVLTAMNPWGGFYQTQSRAWWVERLAHCAYSGIWVLERQVPAVWHQQSNGSGKDDAGHVCGAGIMSYLATHGLAGSDGLLSETYYHGSACFLPLANGRIVTAAPSGPAGQWVMDEQGAQALVDVWQQLQAAKAGQQAPPDPVAEELKAATHAWLAAAQKA